MLVFGREWQFVFYASVDVHHFFALYISMQFFKQISGIRHVLLELCEVIWGAFGVPKGKCG